MTEARNLPPGMTPRLISRDDAALYLGVSGNHFDRHVAPFVAAVMLGCRRLYDVRALDRFVDGRAGPGPAVDKHKLLGALDGGEDQGRQARRR